MDNNDNKVKLLKMFKKAKKEMTTTFIIISFFLIGVSFIIGSLVFMSFNIIYFILGLLVFVSFYKSAKKIYEDLQIVSTAIKVLEAQNVN